MTHTHLALRILSVAGLLTLACSGAQNANITPDPDPDGSGGAPAEKGGAGGHTPAGRGGALAEAGGAGGTPVEVDAGNGSGGAEQTGGVTGTVDAAPAD